MNKIHESFRHGENFEVGEFCIIDKNVIVGNNVKLGNHVVILEGCEVGDGTQIDHYVLLKPYTRIGRKCFVDSYFHSSGHNLIGDNVTLRFNSCICKKAVVEDDVFICPNVMMVYSSPDGSKGQLTWIKEGAYIGTAAVIGPNVIIGEEVIIGANSFVNNDCIKKGTYVGSPAKKKISRIKKKLESWFPGRI